ncbi:MAG: hypothetical protein EOP87_23360 [Verrucomicrobiaceae bacterium]|nr:MAG: hypothetical protein EOP87_23360 [Verrucomicrobiaceae bacterium]
MDRYSFIPARLAKEASNALLIEARLAAENGDVAIAIESAEGVRGLTRIFSDIESPTLLTGTVQMLIQLELEKRLFSDILPSLPPGSRNAAAWEALVNPQVYSPADFARLIRGDWSVTFRQWILPPILDSGELW